MKKIDTLEILKKLISIDSSNSKSNKQIINFIKRLFKNRAEIIEQKYKKDKLDLYNLIIKIKGKSDKNPLIFAGHTDTVNPSNAWNRNPFKPVIEGDKLYGLGTSDMKAGLASMIVAGLESKKPKRDIYLVFDADEEDSGTGGKKVLEIMDTFNIKDAEIIIPEPSTGNITIGQKACFALKIETSGKAAHGSKTTYKNNMKNSAIYKAHKIMTELMKLEKSLDKKKPDNLYGYSTQNIGQIQGGQNVNSVADFCMFTIDRRLLPKEDVQKEIQKAKKLIQKTVPDAKISVQFSGESFSAKQSDKLVKKIANLAHKAFAKKKFEVSYGWNEAAIFSKYGKVVIFGPGIHEQCHQPDEYTSIDLLEKYTDIYKKIMQF
ncbi:M20 family metallopeptidase [Patescibacteria group bacterium]